MSSFIAAGACLNDSAHGQWAALHAQTPRGQTIALEIGPAAFAASGNTLTAMLSGLWCWWFAVCGGNLKEEVLLSLLLSALAVGHVDKALHADANFRDDLAAASAKEPPANMSAVGDIATWRLPQVNELHCAWLPNDLFQIA